MSRTVASDFNNSQNASPASGPMAGLAYCHQCGAAGHAADQYCACCGYPMPKRCRTCGAEIAQAVANYCTQCGGPLKGKSEKGKGTKGGR